MKRKWRAPLAGVKSYPELPAYAQELERSLHRSVREAQGRDDQGEFVQLHWCHWCKAWIEGVAGSRQVADLGLLSGRRGVVYECGKCGREIGFFGAIA